MTPTRFAHCGSVFDIEAATTANLAALHMPNPSGVELTAIAQKLAEWVLTFFLSLTNKHKASKSVSVDA
jgi:hypothetical protein